MTTYQLFRAWVFRPYCYLFIALVILMLLFEWLS